MTYYMDWRMTGIGEKTRTVIVDDNRNIINRSPTEDELKGLKGFPKENYKRPFNDRYSIRYTDEELLGYLRQFYEKYGRLPTAPDFANNLEYPSYITYQRRFGSWNKALEKAFGIKRCEGSKGDCKKYTDEELDYHLIRFYVENGRPPTEKDFTNNPEYSHYSTYIKRFGSWTDALKRVELDVESMVKKGVLVTNLQKGRFGEIIIRDTLNIMTVVPTYLVGE